MGLFAGKWLRAPATMNDEGWRTQEPLTRFPYPDFTHEVACA
jgi:hypothetical protein